MCLKTAYFPSEWKKAKVIPLPKIKYPSNFEHLRSISILPALSKILEKCIEKQIQAFLSENSIIPEKQSGFRSGYSCATTLSDVTDDIFRELDNGKCTVLILLDYSKAFDMLNHSTLIAKLHYYNFSVNAIKLITSFLTDRFQLVELRENKSDSLQVTSGVP